MTTVNFITSITVRKNDSFNYSFILKSEGWHPDYVIERALRKMGIVTDSDVILCISTSNFDVIGDLDKVVRKFA